MPAGGGSSQRLFTVPGFVACISWSPDARRVVYSIGDSELVYQLWVGDVTTGHSAPITAGPDSHYCPAWSPTGDRIAYSFKAEESNLYVAHTVTPDGRDDRRAFGEPIYADRVAWSPTGSSLLVANAETRLTVVDARSGEAREMGGVGYAPAWSPDGATVAVTREDPEQGVSTMGLGGGGMRRVSPPGPHPSADAGSPRGHRMAGTWRSSSATRRTDRRKSWYREPMAPTHACSCRVGSQNGARAESLAILSRRSGAPLR